MDFSAISDDQLVELLRLGTEEACRRNPVVAQAARAAMLDETEKLKIRRAAAERATENLRKEEAWKIAAQTEEQVKAEARKKTEKEEAERQARWWQEKESLGAQFSSLLQLGREVEFKIWKNDSAKEKRVYIGTGYKGTNYVEYFHTGNNKNKPASAIFHSKVPKENRAAIIALCSQVCVKWNMISFPIPEFEEQPEQKEAANG